jgi:hypothetical protein
MHNVKLVTLPGPGQWGGVSANRSNSIDGLNRITAVSGNNYAYDLNGNLTTGDPVWSFSGACPGLDPGMQRTS